VAVRRDLFRKIRRQIDDRRPRPGRAETGAIDGEVKMTGEVHLDGGRYV